MTNEEFIESIKLDNEKWRDVGCICPTLRSLLSISNAKKRLPDDWAHYTTVRDININEPLNLSFHTKIVLTLSNSAAVAFSPFGSVN